MDTPRHTQPHSTTSRLVRVVGALTIVAVAFALVGGLVAPGAGPGHAPHDEVVALTSATPASLLSAAGHDAPRPPRPLMRPRLRVAQNSQDNSDQGRVDAASAPQSPTTGPLSVADADPAHASSDFTIFASRASRTRGQPVLG